MDVLPESVANVVAACEQAKRHGASRIEIRYGRHGLQARAHYSRDARINTESEALQKTMEAHGYKLSREGQWVWLR